MGITVLMDVLADYGKYDLDGLIFLPTGMEPSLDAAAVVHPFDPAVDRRLEGLEGFLGIEQIRDVVEGLEAQLRRATTPGERLRAAAYYAQYDAFINPSAAVDG